jgi:hypothetical protein
MKWKMRPPGWALAGLLGWGLSGAAAVVLCDFGQARFAGVAGHMAIVSERTTRLKILKQAGYSYATVEVPLYHEGENPERLSRLRGFTYVRGADGKVATTKLETSPAVEEKRTNKLKVYKVALPTVQEGAVIEYGYTVTSTFFNNFQDWTFQAEIPTRWSEFRTSIPQVCHYKGEGQGGRPFAVSEMGTGTVSMLLETPVCSAEEPRRSASYTANCLPSRLRRCSSSARRRVWVVLISNNLC